MRELLGHDPEDVRGRSASATRSSPTTSGRVTFLVADGVLPSNEGRGYVLRRILRRAVRHGRLLGRHEPFLAEAAKVVIDTMAEAYPHLEERRAEILGAIAREERQFTRTLEAGTGHLEEALIPLTSTERVVGRRPEDLPADAPVLPGDVGLPAPRHVRLPDRPDRGAGGRVRGRASTGPGSRTPSPSSASAAGAAPRPSCRRQAELGLALQLVLSRPGPDTTFLGYETTTADARVVAILRDGVEYETLEAMTEVELRTGPPRTPRSSSTGRRSTRRAAARSATRGAVRDRTGQRPVRGRGHQQRAGRAPGSSSTAARCTAGSPSATRSRREVDAERRAHTMRNHTGTHVLHRALRNVVGERARQAGSLVTPDYLRFDFPFDRALTDDEQRAIEDEVRRIIREDRPVVHRVHADGRGDRAGRRRVLRREVRRDGPHDPGRGLQLRAVRRHALPRQRPDRQLRDHRRAEHRLRDAPDRGPHRAPAPTARSTSGSRCSSGPRTLSAPRPRRRSPERIAALQDELRETRRRLRPGRRRGSRGRATWPLARRRSSPGSGSSRTLAARSSPWTR